MSAARDRARSFCQRFQLSAPILEAPMAGANAMARSVAISQAGGMGGMGALLSTPAEIESWAKEFRGRGGNVFQFNLWIPDPAPMRDAAHEARLRDFLGQWGPAVPPDAGDTRPPDFAAQCDAIARVAPAAISSIMGLFPAPFVRTLKARGIAWFATATTLAEARAAAEAGADAIIAQGFEAGGHRGAFDAAKAEAQSVGLMALLPRLADQISLPIIATGGIADGRGIAAALTLGASAVQIGTAFLASSEAQTPGPWREALRKTEAEDTVPTRVFSGRLGRAIRTAYVRAATADDAPTPAPHPIQRALTAKMRRDGVERGDLDRIQAWAGQSASLVREEAAADFLRRVWRDADGLLP